MNLSDLQRLAVKEAYAAYFKTPTNSSKAAAKAIIADAEAPATAVLIAAHHLLGPTMLAYEPDTLWLELPEITTGNQDKLSAAIALAMTPSFYWDYRVFGATVHALNNEMVVPEAVPHCTAPQMAWAAFEAELLFALTDSESTKPDYDPSVEAYISVALHEDGFVIAPSGLGFCEGELHTRLSPETETLRSKTKSVWSELPKDGFDVGKFPDDAIGAQLLKLSDCWAYVSDRTKLLRQYIERF